MRCVAGSMYWIDIVANFMTGFVVRHNFNLKRKLVMQPHLIALYYVKHGTFVFDLIAALPFIIEVRRSLWRPPHALSTCGQQPATTCATVERICEQTVHPI